MIISHSIDLAGLANRKIPWFCRTAFSLESLIKVTKSSLPTPLVLTQNKLATHPRIGVGLGSLLTPSKTASLSGFFPATLAWTPVFKRNVSGHLLTNSHRCVYGQKRELLLWGPTREILSGQDQLTLSAQVTNQNTGFPSPSHALVKSAML